MPPPLVEAAGISGSVVITAEDLRALTGEARLSLTVSDALLAAEAEALSERMTHHVLWTRVGVQHDSRSPQKVQAWREAVARWAGEGSSLFGPQRNSWNHEQESYSSAMHHLLLSVPEDDDEVNGRLRNLCYELNMGCDFRYKEPEILTEALGKLGSLLQVIEMLCRNAENRPVPKGSPVNFGHRSLFRSLLESYERLYAPAEFKVSARQVPKASPDPRRSYPGGPALTWCKSLLSLCPQRLRDVPYNDLVPELQELAEWAKRSDAVAERIREAKKDHDKVARLQREKSI